MTGVEQYLSKYQSLVLAYSKSPSEVLLYECSELGKAMALHQLSTEDVIALHERAISVLQKQLTKTQIVASFDLLTEVSVQQTLWLKREMELKALAENEIARKAMLERSIISSFPDVLIKLSIDLEIMDKNEHFFDVFPGQRLESTADLMAMFESEQDFINLKEYTHLTRRRSRLRTALKRHSGESIPCEVTVVLLDGSSDKDEGFLCIIRDLSQQVEITSRLAVAQQMIYDVIEAMPLRIYWKDADLKYLGCNSAYLKDVELGQETDILSKSGTELSQNAQQFSMLAEEQQVICQEISYSECERRIDLGSRALEVRQTIHPLKGLNGDIYGIICCYEDISELKLKEHENTRLAEKLQQSERLDSIGRLAGGIAHDFNNILSVILGYSQMIERKLPVHANDQVFEYVERISSAAQKAKMLTEKLLTFSRKKETNLISVELHQHIQSTLTTYGSIIGEDVMISLTTDKSHWVKADTSQLDQVILNLLVNANDAMNECDKNTQKRIDVTLTEIPSENRVRLIVEDGGSGIPREVQDKIFDPFFTTKAGIGTGLGLSTILGIVLQNDAHISIDSEVGVGTKVIIDWPLSACIADAREHDDRTVTSIASTKPTEHAVICVVEDEKPVRDLISSVLTEVGHCVHAFESGADLFERLDSGSIQPNLLISDIILSEGENGVDLSERFLQKFPIAQRILMSGYSDDLLSKRAAPIGDVIFIAKPFDYDHFIKVVDQTIVSQKATC